MERQKREHRLGLWIQRQISDMKMANNLLPVIEKLARQKQKTKCGRGKAERGKETDTAMITAKIYSNNFITNLHLFCFFLCFFLWSTLFSHSWLTSGLWTNAATSASKRERSYCASGTANRIGAVWFWQYVEPTIMKEIDTETTVVWPAWCYSGKWDTPPPTLPYIPMYTGETSPP